MKTFRVESKNRGDDAWQPGEAGLTSREAVRAVMMAKTEPDIVRVLEIAEDDSEQEVERIERFRTKQSPGGELQEVSRQTSVLVDADHPEPITPRGVVSDRALLDTTIEASGQQRNYLVLPDEERKKAFVRPVRRSYQHVGIAGPKHPLRDLEDAESQLKADFSKFERYPEPLVSGGPGLGSTTGRFWSQADLDRVGKGCGTVTTMGVELAETYARSPTFYSGTFCAGCSEHFPVGADGEFVWDGTDERVGT